MKNNRDTFIDAAIPFGYKVVRPPRIEPYSLISIEEKKLALHNLLSNLKSWSLTNIGALSNHDWQLPIDRAALEQILKEVAIKYATMLFDDHSFSAYQGHFLASVNNLEALNNMYWGKCLDNAGVVRRILNDCIVSNYPDLNLDQHSVRRCEIGGLIPDLRHFAASITLDKLGNILFWDYTTPQYGNFLQPPLDTAAIWGIFSSELDMQESVKSFFHCHGKTVAFQIYQ